MFRAAVIQMTSTSDRGANLDQAEQLIGKAAQQGAELIATPENTNFLGPHTEKVRLAETLEGSTCSLFSTMARRLGVHLLLGSFNEKSDDPKRCYNTSVVFAPTGEQLAVYRKIHLFDVDVSDKVRFRESATVLPGRDPVVVAMSLGQLGLSICYDLRFGELYRRLVELGAEVILVPSAFTATTGKAHWHVLLRARAIESQCYFMAPAQVGRHDDGGLRESFGHAMIVDPWGRILAEVPEGEGVALAEIDLQRVDKVRRAIPVQQHRRL